VQDRLGAAEREAPGDLGEPDVVADAEAERADPWQLEHARLAPGHDALVRRPREQLAVAGDQLALGTQDHRRVVDGVAVALVQGAGDQPDAAALGQRGEALGGRPGDRLGDPLHPVPRRRLGEAGDGVQAQLR
jgi:hypothetical protein